MYISYKIAQKLTFILIKNQFTKNAISQHIIFPDSSFLTQQLRRFSCFFKNRLHHAEFYRLTAKETCKIEKTYFSFTSCLFCDSI